VFLMIAVEFSMNKVDYKHNYVRNNWKNGQ